MAAKKFYPMKGEVAELLDTVKALASALEVGDMVYADLCMGDVEGIGAQIREYIDERNG